MFYHACKRALLAALCGNLSACALVVNDVRDVYHIDYVEPTSDRGIVLFGVSLDAPWPHQEFTVSLDEYDLDHQAITADCWHYNRLKATLNPSSIRETTYFAFSVKPGLYAYSGFNSVGVAAPYNQLAFKVPAGHVTYLGDFVLKPLKGDGHSKNAQLEVSQKLENAQAALDWFVSLRAQAQTVALPETVQITPARPYSCVE